MQRLSEMGVTGLLPFLKKSTDQVNVSQFAGLTAAIDAYVWLHRGAFACADKLVQGEQTTSQRKMNRQKADELLKAGRQNEARDFQRRCVDITHEMALELIKAARKMEVDCIVAPHEADAQLAFLNLQGIAQFVITEDSDLVLFGCNQILYKLDSSGNGLLLRLDRLNLSLGRPHDPPQTLLTKLRHICILSGCDYVSSLPGVGLVKAKKFVMASVDLDICRAVKRLPLFLNLKAKIDDEYVERVRHAELTFRKQLVFDPRSRMQVTMDGEEITNDEPYSGEYLDNETAFSLALGNIDPFSMKQLDDFDPDSQETKTKTRVSAFVTTKDKEVIIETRKATVTPKPKPVDFSPVISDQDLIAMYSTKITKHYVCKNTEIKTRVFDGTRNKEVVKSAYFLKKNMTVKTESIPSQNLIEETSEESVKVESCKTQESPRKIAVRDMLKNVDKNALESLYEAPKIVSSKEIMSLIDSSPTKPIIDNLEDSISHNPFAKTAKSHAKSPSNKVSKVLDVLDDHSAQNDESLMETQVENLEDEPLVMTEELNCNEITETDSQDMESSQNVEESSVKSDNPQSQFRYGRPLFKKTSDDSADDKLSSTPKSPILGKRKRTEDSVFPMKRVCSRNISSLLQFARTQSKQQASTSPSSTHSVSNKKRHSVGLSKGAKVDAQSSLYKFGFTKK
ncbi:hypothetical protein B566_EDAN011582 [Ephemera danica]|nr:hypothetical protein B566_EDAN011582 [Ephemera danica]